MATIDGVSERVARLEGAYEHLATKADLFRLETRLIRWTIVTGIGVAGIVIAVIIAAMKLLD